MRNRTKLFVFNAGTSAVQQIVLFIAGLVIPAQLLRAFGSDVNGFVSSVTQMVSYIQLIEAGLSASVIYYLYRPLAERDEASISRIVSAAKHTYYKLGWIFVAIAFLIALGFGLLMEVPGLSWLDVFALAMAIGVAGSLEFFTLAKYKVILTADQRTYVIALSTIVGSFLNIVITVLCVKLSLSVVVLKILAIFSVFGRSFILSWYYRRNYGYVDPDAKPDNHALEKRGDALFLQVLWSIQAGAPVLILTFFSDLTTVSIYSIYNLVIYGLNNVVSIFMTGLQAAFGEIMVQDDEEKLHSIYQLFIFAFYMILTVLYACAAVLIQPFIRVYTLGLPDSAMYDISMFGVLFVVNGFLFSIKTPQGMIVMAAGHYKETKMQTILQGAILVVGGIVFTGALGWGIYGVLIAAIASNLYRAIEFLWYVERNIISGTWKMTAMQQFTAIVLIVACYVGFYNRLFWVSSYITWFIAGVMTGCVAGAGTLLTAIVFHRHEAEQVWRRMKLILHR